MQLRLIIFLSLAAEPQTSAQGSSWDACMPAYSSALLTRTPGERPDRPLPLIHQDGTDIYRYSNNLRCFSGNQARKHSGQHPARGWSEPITMSSQARYSITYQYIWNIMYVWRPPY